MKFPYYSSYPLSAHHLQVLILLIILLPQWLLEGGVAGNDTDMLALLKLKEGITIDPDRVFDTWNESIPFCNWTGVTCGRKHQRVTSLVLKSHKLVGPVSPYIGNLSFLRLLDFRNNHLRGEIPTEIGKLFRLELLFLNGNTLVGGIPANLTGCSQLRGLFLMYNNLSGGIPPGLGSLIKLEQIQLSVNSFSGKFPSTLGNMTSLIAFGAVDNRFTGRIPDSLGRLPGLQLLRIGVNDLSGTFPPALFNMSSMVYIITAENHLTGTLPDDIGLTLPNLQYFGIGRNEFYGSIPSSLVNATGVVVFDISNNSFVGQVPSNLGNLQNLQWLNLGGNSLGRNSTRDLSFMTSLQNCTNLDLLSIGGNNFGGYLPSSIGNLSVRLTQLYLAENQFTGNIPSEIGNLVNLITLNLGENLLAGNIPFDVVKLRRLQGFGLYGNRLSGSVPSFIGNLTQLVVLDISDNSLGGSIPPGVGNLLNLIQTDFSQNNFTGAIPEQLLGLSSLITLNLSKNAFTENLSAAIGKLTHLGMLDVSDNHLSGEIPIEIGECLSMEHLYMHENFFRGSIPSSIASLENLVSLNLSRNNLTGQIPKGLQNFTYLSYLNVSFNDLEGEVPIEGVFNNSSSISLIGNTKLCGGIPELSLPQCTQVTRKKQKSIRFKLIIIIISVSLFVIVSSLALLVIKQNKKSKKVSSIAERMNQILKVSYRDLHQATDSFSSRNLIGTGSYGYVYKAHLDQLGRIVAIKVLNLQQKGASKSFEVECNVLKSIRHRNLLKIITYCSSLDKSCNVFNALVFEYMENGSLERWLHPDIDSDRQSLNLNFFLRLNIAIDVASALDYLHNLSKVPVIHCDLKPSNILLDKDMVAHVSDFGLAKLLPLAGEYSHSETSSIRLRGTVGYAAPEYGMGEAASKEGDVYSFGILLLEMFTGKRPTHEMFKDGFSLHGFVKTALPRRLDQIVDSALLIRGQEATEAEVAAAAAATNRDDGNVEIEEETNSRMELGEYEKNSLVSIFEIGVACSVESPKDRLRMGDIVRKLHLIKTAYVHAQGAYPRRRAIKGSPLL